AIEAWNVRKDVEKLKRSMTEIESVILDADERQKITNNHELNYWMETLNDALHAAEGFFDEVSTEKLTRE
ncbi:disease resistance protein, partial [Trifolium medium]|nr:disease resistance protein [Trifolium medium]